MKINLEDESIEKIKTVLKNHYNIKKVILFGSRAKGNAKIGSDIDIAVIGERITFREICRLGSEFDELNLPYKIDIVDYSSIKNQKLKEHIDRVGIVL